jgi:hypothetical protein
MLIGADAFENGAEMELAGSDHNAISCIYA